MRFVIAAFLASLVLAAVGAAAPSKADRSNTLRAALDAFLTSAP